MDPMGVNHRRHRRSDRPSYLLVAMLGAVLGVMVTLAAAPHVLPYVYELEVQEPPAPLAPSEDTEAEPPGDAPKLAAATMHLEETVKAVVREVGPSVMAVINRRTVTDLWGRSYTQDGQGSGVIIDEAGHVVTNYHVIEGATDIIVEDYDGVEHQAQVVGTDPATDLAVLRIEGVGLNPVPFADSDDIEPGQLAVAIGNPLGREFARSVTLGIVSGVRASMYGQGPHQRVFQLIQTDASINPGNSGGALLDSRGHLVGINTLKFASAEVEGMGFAIPSNTVLRIVRQIIEHGEVRRAWMGMTGMSAADAALRDEDVPTETGVYVDRVLEDSPAWQGGLRARDIIVRIDNTSVQQMVDFLAFLEEAVPGHTVVVEVVRGDEHLTLEITLGVMPT